MKKKESVVLIKHSTTWSGDRCSAWFDAHGYELEWCHPVDGQALPDPARFDAAVIFGGRNSVNDSEDWIAAEHRWLEGCLKTDCRYFGICFGAQLLAKVLGAQVQPHSQGLKEIGFHEVSPVNGGEKFLFPEPTKLFQWHGDGFEIPHGATLLATGERFPNQAFHYGDNAVGVQFHPEVNHTVAKQWFSQNDDYESEFLDPANRTANLEYAEINDGAIDAWFDSFLSGWLSRS